MQMNGDFFYKLHLFQRFDGGDDDGAFGAAVDDVGTGWIGDVGSKIAYLGMAKESDISHATAYTA